MTPNLDVALRRLRESGLIEEKAEGYATTRRWQAAMARAALRLMAAGDPGEDLRVPVTAAIVEIYGGDLDEDQILDMIAAMLPIELTALGLHAGSVPQG